MARSKIDLNDAIVSPFFVLASGVQAGLFDLELFGINFTEPLLTVGSGTGAMSLTVANLIMIAALGVAFATNRPSLDEMKAVETFVAVATVGLVLAPPFSPVLANVIQSSVVTGLFAVVLQAAGFYTLSYLG